jgi:hypothetical protein
MPVARGRPATQDASRAPRPGRGGESQIAALKSQKRGPSPGRRVGLGPTLGQRLM